MKDLGIHSLEHELVQAVCLSTRRTEIDDGVFPVLTHDLVDGLMPVPLGQA